MAEQPGILASLADRARSAFDTATTTGPAPSGTQMVRLRSDWKQYMPMSEAITKARQQEPAYAGMDDDAVAADILSIRGPDGQLQYEAYSLPAPKNDADIIRQMAASGVRSGGKTIWEGVKGLAMIPYHAGGALNPIGSPQSREESWRFMANFNPATMGTALVDYAKRRFAGTMDALAAAGASASGVRADDPVMGEWVRQNVRDVINSPVAQNLREDPVGMMADVSAAVSLPTSGVKLLSKVAQKAATRTAGIAPAASAAVQRGAAKTASVAGRVGEVAEGIDPLVLASRGVRTAASVPPVMKGRQAVAKSIMGGILESHARRPEDVEAMMGTVLKDKITIGKGGLEKTKAKINELTNTRDTAIIEAAHNPETASINSGAVYENVEPVWNEYAGDLTSMTKRKDQVWSQIDAFLKGHAGTSLDPRRRPGVNAAEDAADAASAATANFKAVRKSSEAVLNDPKSTPKARDRAANKLAEARDAMLAAQKSAADAPKLSDVYNPPFSESVVPVDAPRPMSMESAPAIRHSMNRKLDKAFDARSAGVEDPVVSAQTDMALLEGYNDQVFTNVENMSRKRFAEQRRAAGLPDSGSDFELAFQKEGMTVEKLKEMGKYQHILMEVRNAIENSMVKHGKRAVPLNEQPYMVAQGGLTMRDIALGRMPGPTQAAASVMFALRALAKYAPEQASAFALRLYHTNPDPRFWGGVLDQVRLLQKGQEQIQSTTPPAPPGVQAKPAMPSDFEDGPGDFK